VIHGKEARDLETGELRHILFNKNTRIVLLVGIAAFRVYVYPGTDGDTFSQ
jgi:hypothetical protein